MKFIASAIYKLGLSRMLHGGPEVDAISHLPIAQKPISRGTKNKELIWNGLNKYEKTQSTLP